jgi:hypothetical protein
LSAASSSKICSTTGSSGCSVDPKCSRVFFGCFFASMSAIVSAVFRAFFDSLDERELLLQLRAVSFDRARQHAEQLLDLDLLRERDATKLLDVFLAPQIHEHQAKFHRAVVDPRRALLFFLSGERRGHDDRGGQRAMADELAALDKERELGRGHAHHVAIRFPRRCKSAAHLARATIAIDEEEQIAAQRMSSEALF